MLRHRIAFLVLACSAFGALRAAPPEIDLLSLGGWREMHEVRLSPAGPGGLRAEWSSQDPYFATPEIRLAATAIWLELEGRCSVGGRFQIFWFSDRQPPSEAASTAFGLKENVPFRRALALPALTGPGFRLRLDPPGGKGELVLTRVRVRARQALVEPAWPKVQAPVPSPKDARLSLGGAELRVSRDAFGAASLLAGGRLVAHGWPQPWLGVLAGDRALWTPVTAKPEVRAGRDAVETVARFRTRDGANWAWALRYSRAGEPGALRLQTSIAVDRDVALVFAPAFVWLAPGKLRQAVLPGLEYLEPPDQSSGERSVRGPAARRRVPALHKLTIPMAAVATDAGCLSVEWEDDGARVWFDVPDRKLGSGASLIGRLWPADGPIGRDEGSLMPLDATTMQAGRPLRTACTLRWIPKAPTVAPALERYVLAHGLPAAPKAKPPSGTPEWFAEAWLDSGIREGARYRHAWWPGVDSFQPQPSADAAAFELLLARQVASAELASRLTQAARDALDLVPVGRRLASRVGHLPSPAPSLLTRPVSAEIQAARGEARRLLAMLDDGGIARYRRQPGKPDYASTHWQDHANGLSAQVLHSAMEAVLLSGDPQLKAEFLLALGRFDRTYGLGVPRGAQTWEVPLHAPDILASAHAAACFAKGFAMTGDGKYLERARYWAWTGLPFVYLRQPVPGGSVGLYATIAVFGATDWVANWMGLPVQWCGLVYADALYDLAEIDPGGPWRKLADGIVASGVQQSFSADAGPLRGLLPDSFELFSQTGNPVAINPGTLQAVHARSMGQPLSSRAYDRQAGVLLTALGGLRRSKDGWEVRGWTDPTPLLVGFGDAVVTAEGRAVRPVESGDGWALYELPARCRVSLRRR